MHHELVNSVKNVYNYQSVNYPLAGLHVLGKVWCSHRNTVIMSHADVSRHRPKSKPETSSVLMSGPTLCMAYNNFRSILP